MSLSHNLDNKLSQTTSQVLDTFSLKSIASINAGRLSVFNFSLWALLFTLSITLFSGCEKNPDLAGGTDFPNEINGTVAKVDQSPVSQAVVKLYKRRQIEERNHLHPISEDFEVVETDTTDSQGNFHFDTESGSYFIEATYDSQLINVSDSIFFEDNDTVKVDLSPILLYFGGTLQGRVIADGFDISQVDLAGTPYTTEVAANGDFKFTNLPPGTYGLISFFGQGDLVSGSSLSLGGQVQPDSIIDLGTIEIRTNELLFEDFEYEDERSITGYLYGGGWWYGTGSGKFLSNHGSPGYPVSESVIQDQDNRVFYANWNFLNDEKESQYYVFGFNLGYGADGWIEENTPYELSFFNFSQVDKISFRAKGTGTLRLQLGSKEIRLRAVSEVAHYGTEVTLGPEYQEFVIDINDFTLGKTNDDEATLLSDLTWEQARKDIYALAFIVTSDSEIWLDDIKLLDYTIHQF